MRGARRRESGVILVMVLVFLLLLVSSVAAFQRRAVLDATIVQLLRFAYIYFSSPFNSDFIACPFYQSIPVIV